jgi:hypothetical protein
MDLYKTGMLVTMCVCVRGSIFVFMDLYKTGMLVAMFLSGGSIVPLSTILIFDFFIFFYFFLNYFIYRHYKFWSDYVLCMLESRTQGC